MADRVDSITHRCAVFSPEAHGAPPMMVHRLHLGMPGMHGTVSAVGALQRSDLLIALGARFDDRVTGKLDTFAPDAKVIHADIDPAEISKNRIADVPIVGDARQVIASDSGHYIHLEQPALVIEAIRQVVEGVRHPDTWSDLVACCAP